MKRHSLSLALVLFGLAVIFSTSTSRSGAREVPDPKQDAPARLTIYVRPDAHITVNGYKTKSTGDVRQFVSPPLPQGGKFIYTVKAAWKEGRQEVSRERQARVQAGQETVVDFRRNEDKDERGQRLKAPGTKGADVPSDREPDVVYWPTPENVVEKMLELANVKKEDVIYDLGCGDARILVMAAKKYGVRGFGFDIDPERVRDSLENVRKNKVEHLVTIKKADIFTLDLRDASVVTLYLLPELNVRLKPQLEKLRPGSRIVSHDFDMKGAKPNKVVSVRATNHMGMEGTHRVYLWIAPWEKE